MYLDELSIIFCNYHCNFLAMAITPYQAVGVNAAISYLESIGVEINGYILMTSHPETGRTLDESYFRTGNHKIKCIDFEYSFKDRNIIKQIKSRINQFIIVHHNIFSGNKKPLKRNAREAIPCLEDQGLSVFHNVSAIHLLHFPVYLPRQLLHYKNRLDSDCPIYHQHHH